MGGWVDVLSGGGGGTAAFIERNMVILLHAKHTHYDHSC